VIALALAVAASVGAGWAAERRGEAAARSAARSLLDAMLYVLVPFVTFVNIARLHLSTGVGVGIGLAYLELAAVGWLAWLLGARVLRLGRPATGALMCAAVLANTGYLGLPLTLAVLGSRRLGEAIAFDTLVTGPMLLFVGFAIGAAFGDKAGETRRERLRAYVVRNPPLLAVAAGLLAPASAAPHALIGVSHVVVLGLLPLGFFALGVNLSAEAERGRLRPSRALRAPLAVALGLRLAVAPAIMLALSALVVTVPDAYLLESAMPCAISTLLVAHAYGLDLRLATSAIAWSTALVLVAGLGASAVF
jgi:predicted permease